MIPMCWVPTTMEVADSGSKSRPGHIRAADGIAGMVPQAGVG